MEKRPLDLDWKELLPDHRRSPAAAEAEETESEATASHVSDYELKEKVQRISKNKAAGLFERLPDKGQKYLLTHMECLKELDRRKVARMQKDVENEGTKSPDRSGVGSNITSMETNFQEKSEDKTDAAFSEELKLMGHDKYRSLSEIGMELHKERKPSEKSPKRAKNGSRELSSRKNKWRSPNCKLSDSGCPSVSSSQAGKSLSRRFSHRRRAANRDSTNWEFEEVHHVVLVDDEDPQPVKSIHGGDTSDDWGDYKIYYPSRDDPECVDLSYSDLKCLDPESYLTSPIMNFYIQYLQRSPSLMAKSMGDFYIFNTYFYNKLEEAMTCKDKMASFLKLRRWWKGVDIFRKSYIFLPIHGDMHWSLAIICVPAKEDDSGLIILHLDSLGLHGSSHIFTIVGSYLKHEWLYIIQNDPPQDLPISERLWNQLPRRIEKERIMVPQQKNEYDCGLFVLYFLQRFIEEAPARLRKKDLIMFGRKWFPPEEASGLRSKVKEVVVNEFETSMLNLGPQKSRSNGGERL